MVLTEYKRKRHFNRTPEPVPKTVQKVGWSYAVQKHDASHLHYDFRLELDGVLKSWAVPKGPSLDPSVKRLAMEVEDHPVQYGTFEGIIPEGEYGGGTVMLWDSGTWDPVGDPHDGYRRGKLKFNLHGTKLQGGWTLVKTRNMDPGKGIPWLLIKERDDKARSIENGDILEEMPLSVMSGRDLNEIAADKDASWSANGESKSKRSATTRKSTSKTSLVSKGSKDPRDKVIKARPSMIASKIQGSKTQPLPRRIEVQLATLTKEVPQGTQWLHEIKFDGYRMICRIDGKNVRFISRNHQDWTDRLHLLTDAVRRLPVKQAILDGEIVVLKPDGRTDFQLLQNAFRDDRAEDIKYFLFDLLHLDGKSLIDVTLEERKRVLAELLSAMGPESPLQYSEHYEGSGTKFQQKACRLKLEGIISKRRDQPYRPGRGSDWLKVKCGHTEEFVIGGYTEPAGSRHGFGALLVGYYDADQKLRYAGKVGTGFDSKSLQSMSRRLQAIEQTKSPFSERTSKTGPTRTAHWVKPSLVAQISYGSRTRDGILRHSVFKGLREDKPAKDVKLEKAIPVERAVKAAKAASSETVKPSATPRARRENASDNGSEYDSKNQSFAGVRLSSPTKLLYPEIGITKLDLARYYRDVAQWILPHIVHRPLVLVRCPDGQSKECFYQKHPGVGTPENLRQIRIRESSKTENYVVVDDVDGLISLAQLGSLEVHAWGSKEDKLERPDRLIFDLDPSDDVDWKRVVESARQINEFLQEIGLESFVKTTGGKGLHLVVPIQRRHAWDEAKAFSKMVANRIATAAPHQFTVNMSKAARPGKIFLDYLRNGRGATAVVPYSPRSRPAATVSTPLAWKELSSRIRSDHYTIENVRKRLATLTQDPWERIFSLKQSLTGPLKILRELSPGS